MESSHLSPLCPSMSPTPTCRTASPSPSSSSEKSASYQTVDPLLSNLSPESTIEALTSTDAVPTKEKDTYDVLSKSISQVSPSERALGIRAALAAQRLGLWYKEVQTWDWPTQAEAQLGKGFVPPSDDMDATELLSPETPVVDHYGSLPARLVKQYEKRIEEIKDGMESLNVEELKGHVLNAHIPSRSRPSSANSSASTPPPLSYVQLSDFTAVITATILRALPLLSRLNSILASWDARLRVLRQIPGLLYRLRRTRFELDSSRSSLSSTNPPDECDSVYSNSNFRARRGELESMVSSAGRRMDSMLDRLEGREDSLPENWIDDLEAIETDFGAWAKDAERRAAECEEARLKEEETRRAAQSSLEQSLRESENSENPSPNPHDSVAPDVPTPMETIDEEPGCVELTDGTHEEETPPELPAVAPIGVHIIPSSNDPSANPSLATSPAPSEPSPPASPDRTPAQRLYAQDKDTEASPPRKQQLDSPIKLSETLQKHMRGEGSPKSAIHRRTSSASTESSTSDFPSLVSSPEVRGARAASSNGTPLFLKTPPQFQSDHGSSRDAAGKHTVQENSPLRLSDQNTPRAPVMHNRAVSLSLQRFINEGLENHHEKGDLEGRRSSTSTRRASVGSPINRSEVRQETRTPVRKGSSKAPPGSVQRGNQQLANSQVCEPTVKAPKASGHNKEAYLRNFAQRPDPPARSSKPQLAEQQAVHSGLAARKHYRPSAQLMEEEISTDSGSDKPGSRSSTQGKRMTRPNDRMDQKVNSILSTLPAPIHLVSADQERDSSSGASTGERPGAGSRINASAPITLTPALSRRRYSHSRTPEESSVKVYHLHRGGKSVPTRLFVRTVGESGGRVMVRVGGGWADLGEYLREYAVHHGSRSVSETPRVEVQGLSPSPNGSPAAASNERDGARRSIISSRPASSVAVHKKRRGSNVSEMTDVRTTPAGEGLSTSPFSTISNRRHSVSSNGSIGATSSTNDAYHRSFTASTSIPPLNSTPLGLAGPKPRSRQISMSPAGEAWVEDVLGQARRSSSLNPHKLGLAADSAPKLSKARSIGDIGSAATSTRRVALRGLGERSS